MSTSGSGAGLAKRKLGAGDAAAHTKKKPPLSAAGLAERISRLQGIVGRAWTPDAQTAVRSMSGKDMDRLVVALTTPGVRQRVKMLGR